MNREQQRLLTDHLASYITRNKKDRIAQVLSKRTTFITLVLEDIYQSQNASAVVRSCDCFGIADVHIIENHNQYFENKNVLQGASKWVSIHRYQPHSKKTTSTKDCLVSLKKAGYRLVGTSPHSGSTKLADYKIIDKTAIVFGTEETGLSDAGASLMDDMISINMVGFTESLNISVSAAICLYVLTSQLRKSRLGWQLSDEQKDILRLQWFRSVVRGSHLIEKNFLNTI